MADAGSDEGGDVGAVQAGLQLRAAAQQHVHHLGHAEAVAEVVERVCPVAGLHRQLGGSRLMWY